MNCKNILFLVVITWVILPASGCSTDSGSGAIRGELQQISVHDVDFNDPSGLTLDVSGEFLWCVSSERGGHIYRLSFEGESLAVLPYEGDDMEGITMNPNDKTIWIAEERLRQVIQLDTLGNILQIVDVPVEKINENDGLEGISVNPENNHLFVLNEKNPRAFIELNAQMDQVRYEEIDFDPPFVMTDLSGLFYDHSNREFWMVSDESKKIVITDFELNPKKYFLLDREKFEGIAIDFSSNRLYLVNDEENKLFVYEIL